MADEVETSTDFAEKIFSVFGSIRDGAASIYGDYLEYRALEKELEAQASGLNTTTQPAYNQTSPAASVAGLQLNQNTLIYGAIGFSALLTLFVALK